MNLTLRAFLFLLVGSVTDFFFDSLHFQHLHSGVTPLGGQRGEAEGHEGHGQGLPSLTK